MNSPKTVYEDELAAAKARIVKQGPCAFCGDGYAAHRLIDAQMGRTGAGDSIESVADDYDTTVGAMVATWIAYVDLLHDDIDHRAEIKVLEDRLKAALAASGTEPPTCPNCTWDKTEWIPRCPNCGIAGPAAFRDNQ